MAIESFIEKKQYFELYLEAYRQPVQSSRCYWDMKAAALSAKKQVDAL